MPVLPGSDNLFPKLLMVEAPATPATPAAGVTVVYCKSSDGKLYAKDDAGVERALESAADLAAHLADATDAHDASAVSIVDSGGYFPGLSNVETALQSTGAHLTDATDAHDASAISIADAGTYFTATDVEGALQELGAGGGGGGSVATDAIWDAAGDLAVGTGANTAAKLTKGSDGDVLSVVAGAVAWAAPGSAAAYDPIAALFGTPDTAYEFDTSSLTGLTGFGTPDTENADTSVPDHYYIADNASSTALCGRSVAASGSAMTLITKLTDFNVRSGYNSAGLFVSAAGPASIDFLSLALNRVMQVERFTNLTTYSSTIATVSDKYDVPLYMAIRINSGTSVDYFFSSGGQVWTPLALARNPSITMALAGIMFKSENSAGAAAVFDYLRIWNSAKTFLTGA